MLKPAAVRPAFDFDRAPFLAIWEVTRACALACVHCRADAIPCRDSHELTTQEGFRLIDQIRAIGETPPLFVLTGGDPMRRLDLGKLVRYATDRGLRVSLSPQRDAQVRGGGPGRVQGRRCRAHFAQSRREIGRASCRERV